jgi:glutamate synthase domain-containing protein 3
MPGSPGGNIAGVHYPQILLPCVINRGGPTVVETTLDADRLGIREINAALHRLPAGARVRVVNPRGRHNLAVGLNESVRVDIAGPVGHYAGGLGKYADVTVSGSAGRGVGENLMSGRIRVAGGAGRSAAASARGGTIVIEGDCAPCAGIALKGGTLAIAGDAGPYCGWAAQSGVILVGGDTGRDLGDSLHEAVIYVAGRIGGLGADARAEDVDENDVTAAKLLTAACGFAHIDPENLVKVVSRHQRPRFAARRRDRGRVTAAGFLSTATA